MDHLLRTLAAISPEARVLHVGCGDGSITLDIARLGFETWACDKDPSAARNRLAPILGMDLVQERVTAAAPEALDYHDSWFDWVVAWFDMYPTPEAFGEVRRVLKPGGWVWAATPGSSDVITEAAFDAGLAIAERVATDERGGERVLRGIFRRVGDGVTG